MSTEQSTVKYAAVPNCPGYRAGSDGTIWSCLVKVRRTGVGGRGFHWIIGPIWRQKKLCPGRAGYLGVEILGKTRLAHLVILEAFRGPRPPGMQACHDPDHTPSNIALSNLRWDTRTANYRDRDRQGRTAKGTKQGLAKLTDDIVREVLAAHASPGRFNQSRWARKLDISQAAVWAIINRKTWKHINP